MDSAMNISEHEVAAEFLRAEVDSPRWGPPISFLLQLSGHDRSIIDSPNLNDAYANQLRSCILGITRGWKTNSLLFSKFPDEVEWQKLNLDCCALSRAKLLNSPPWNQLLRGNLMACALAKATLPGSDAQSVMSVIAKIRLGMNFPRIILVKQSASDDLVVIEGCIRTLAYVTVLENEAKIPVIVGSSDAMKEWDFYGDGRANSGYS
jgi:hypothetical protein